jgi:hypothetical protein
MALSAAASLFALVYLVTGYLFTMNAFEPLFWAACAYLLARMSLQEAWPQIKKWP